MKKSINSKYQIKFQLFGFHIKGQYHCVNKCEKTKHWGCRWRCSANSTWSSFIGWSKHRVFYLFDFLKHYFLDIKMIQIFTTSFFISFSDECFIKPCSSKATSVIRLACQKSPKVQASSSPSSSPTSQTKSDNIRLTNRQTVKKLVLKLKKPFVPVIEEEANLHPPGKYIDDSLFQSDIFMRIVQNWYERQPNLLSCIASQTHLHHLSEQETKSL